MKLVNEVDRIIEGCIHALSTNHCLIGADRLQDLARYWAVAGMDLKSFLDMKTYILESAKKKSNNDNLEDDLKIAEVALTEKRKQEWQAKNPSKHNQHH